MGPVTPTLSYDAVGATAPDESSWGPTPSGYRRHESTVVLGHGDVLWTSASTEVLSWAVKARSGFDVPADRAEIGQDVTVVARLGPFRVHEPVRVVGVVETPDRVGFAYGTRPGHPVSGEEAFVVHRSADGSVCLTLRSVTRAPRGRWRWVYPVALVLQHGYRRRYRRALLT